MDINQIIENTTKAEEDVDKLYKWVDDYNNSRLQSQELTELIGENNKLKYRLSILKRAINDQLGDSKKDKLSFISVQESLSELCLNALKEAFPDVNEEFPGVQLSGRPQFGDYQFNASMQVAKLLRNQGQKTSPAEIAKKIVEKIPSNSFIEKTEVVPSGFINIWISKQFCSKLVTQWVTDRVKPPPVEKKLRVIVDFSAPNIAKQMHVGHLRSTIIGDSIARLLEFLGHDVLRINHVGDWGTQFGMLIAHLKDKYPNYLNESPPIEDLQNFYKESKARFDEDEEFKKRAYSCVVQLQSFDKDHIKAWELICDKSRQEFQKIYDRLDIRLIERGESFYQKRMEKVVAELESRGLLENDEGRKIIFGLEEGMIPMTIVKSDGGFTYDTSDVAALQQRIEEEKAEWIIYVTDAGQANHFKLLFSVGKKIGLWDPNKVKLSHVGFGVVLGEDKKRFKTRSGETIKLIELLDEGLKRAEEKLKEKNRDSVLTAEELKTAQEAVAYGCIKYADLAHNRTADYIFSFDKMLEDRGNTAVYMLYALTRIRAIARNANISSEQLRDAVKNGEVVPVNHIKEWNLVKILLRFNDILYKVTQELYVHYICEYLYDIATAFTEFYDTCYCIEKDGQTGEIKKIHMDRLLLCEATALVMEKCFDIIGLKQVSKM